MPGIWIKSAAVLITLAWAVWSAAAFWQAYRLTRLLHFRSGGLSSLILAGATIFMLWIAFTSAGRDPNAVTVVILLFTALGNCAYMWFGRSYFPRYRHSRDILLFRPPPDEDVADPVRGLYVPKAMPVPPPPQTQRRIAALVIVIALGGLLVAIALGF